MNQASAQSTGMLGGLRVIEHSAFIAAPLAGMTLAQLGAEVIRIDPIGGNVDIGRWPLTASGRSLYWACLNRGKQSIELDLRSTEGREIAGALITQPGPGGGIYVTNLPASQELSFEALSRKRPDLIMITVEGNPNGSTAIDYTANAGTGFAFVTGEAAAGEPVNHVLPAWDVMTAHLIVIGLLAAERRRLISGRGEHIHIALSDVALATTANLGYFAEVEVNGEERRRFGNYIFGTFGRDFATSDGRRVMIVAVTKRQWRALVDVTGTAEPMAALARSRNIDLDDEGARFDAREEISAIIAPWFAARTLGDIRSVLEASAMCWAPYQSFGQVVREDPRYSTDNPLFTRLDHPGIGAFLTPGTPLRFAQSEPGEPGLAPELGADTGAVLSNALGFDADKLRALRTKGVIGTR